MTWGGSSTIPRVPALPRARSSSSFCFGVFIAALILGSCDDFSDPLGPTAVVPVTNLTATPAATPGAGEDKVPQASFKVSPGPGPDGVIRATVSLDVFFDLCATVNPDPTSRELYFALDFLGDGSATHAGTTGSDCRFTFHYYGNFDVVAQVCVVDRDLATHTELHDFQCATYRVVVTAFCHSINAATSTSAEACPTGETLYCDAAPLVGTSSSQAHGACDRCYGQGTCVGSPFHWEGPFTSPVAAAFIFGDVTAFVCPPTTVLSPGSISRFNCDFEAGRWAP
jgi:hypothetical protein